MPGIIERLISAIKFGGKSQKATEGAVGKELGQKKETLKTIRNILICITVLTALVTGILGYFSILPLTANGVRVSGLGGAIEAAFYSLVGVIVFIVLPIIALVGIYQTVRYALLGIDETLDTSSMSGMTSNIARFFKSPGARIVGRIILRWLFPFGMAVTLGFFLPLLLSEIIGLVLNLAINLKDKKRPYIAYLFALIDAAWAGYDGSLLSPVSNVITAIKPAWTSGLIGTGIMIAVFAFFTGVWSIFSNKEQ